MNNMFKEACEYLKPKLEGSLVENEELKKYTTLRVGGPAALFAQAKTLNDLKLLLGFAHEKDLNYLLIGRGANLLISDKGFEGLVIRLGHDFNRISVNTKNATISAGGAITLATLLKDAQKHLLEGLEFVAGIPATVGKAIASNAGAFGKSVCQFITEIKVVDENGLKVYKANTLEYGYRKGPLKEGEIVAEAVFQLKVGEKGIIKGRTERFFKKRKQTQPLNYANAGSVFKNPSTKISAAELIEKCGLKGLTEGDAMISDVHANFIINKGRAKAADIYILLDVARKKVKEKYDILLEPEIKTIGNFDKK